MVCDLRCVCVCVWLSTMGYSGLPAMDSLAWFRRKVRREQGM